MKRNYDICVVGAGPGGFMAALAAKKTNPEASVLLVERSGHLGGMAASGIPFLGFLDKQQRKIIGGLSDTLIERLVEKGGSRGIRHDPHHVSISVATPDVVKIAIGELCEEAGVDVLLHCELCDATSENGRVTSATFVCCGNKTRIEAEIFIDATGDGTLAYLSGAEVEKGRGAEGKVQPPSCIYTIQNVDKERIISYLEKKGAPSVSPEYMRADPNYCVVCLNDLWQELNPIGQWPMQIWAFICVNSLNKGEVFVNGPRMPKTDPTDPISMTRSELLGQRQAFQFTEVLRKHVAGFEDCFISHINDSLGVRETRRIMGRKLLCVDEVKNGETPADTIALAGYPIDIHSSDDNTSIMIRMDKPFGVPYGCLVSRSFDNLMMCGKHISVDPDVFGATRVMATCFALGQAAGTAAAMALREGVHPAALNVQDLQAQLEKDGAILR